MSVYEKQILMQIWGGRTSLLNLSRWAREKSILQDSTSEGSAAAALKAQLMLFREQSRLIKVHLMFFREYSRSNKEGCVHACVQASVCVWGGVGVCVHVNVESWVQFSRSVMSDSLWPHEPQHTRPPCPSPTPGVYPNSCPLSRWCHTTVSSSVGPFSSCPQFFQHQGLFKWVSPLHQVAKVLEIQLQHQSSQWVNRTGWISLLSQGLSRVFSNTTVQKHQFFSAQLSL